MEVENLNVYQRLCGLVLRVHELTMSFPKFELYELGSQTRRSSNGAAANLAEGFGNKHTNIYTECISRSQGEIRETIHHLRIANSKKYLSDEDFNKLKLEYQECSKMLYGLEKSLELRKRK
jgi:four helix bundle protein